MWDLDLSKNAVYPRLLKTTNQSTYMNYPHDIRMKALSHGTPFFVVLDRMKSHPAPRASLARVPSSWTETIRRRLGFGRCLVPAVAEVSGGTPKSSKLEETPRCLPSNFGFNNKLVENVKG